jgi:hypothetical protein
VLVQLVSEELRAISPYHTRIAVSEIDGSPVLQGGLDSGLARVRARLFDAVDRRSPSGARRAP